MNMAAKECEGASVENIVNRWIVDYYLLLALESFRREQYADFCGIKNVLDSVLVRSLESTTVMPTKIRVLQFLSYINEGERFDASSGSDQSTTPLEAALILLEDMRQDCSISQQDFKNACTSVKEMIVVIFMKNNQFDKAKQMLIKHFPKPMVGKKAIFMGLINQRSNMHDIIDQVDFHQFKREMSAFCQRLCSFSHPFLLKAANRLIDKRFTEEDDAESNDEEEPVPSTSSPISTVLFVPCANKMIQRTRLEAAYKILAARSDKGSFAQLEEEVEREEQVIKEKLSLRLSPSPTKNTSKDSEQDLQFQRSSESPMEASLADQSPQMDAFPQTQAGSLSKSPSEGRRQHFTVARLVSDADSQVVSQCTAASRAPEPDVAMEERQQSPIVPNEEVSQSPLSGIEVTKPSRKHRRRAQNLSCRASTTLAGSSTTDGEDDLPDPVINEEILHNRSNSSLGSHSPKSHVRDTSPDTEKDPLESSASTGTPVQKTPKKSSHPPSNDPDDVYNIDSSLDSSPSLFRHPVPRTSSTPHDSAKDKGPSGSKWKLLFNNAKESKERWSDEESDAASKKNSGSHESISNSNYRKRKWTERETQMLREGVKKFGEGNWSSIKGHYSFDGRTNVNLKDRWRTMKKLNQV